jgi:O-antigen/teichoic acid export membrane protein
VPSKPSASLTATVLGGIRLTTAGYLATQAITLTSYLVLAHVATPADFGEFAAGSIFIGFAFVFSESGMLAALVQRRDRLDEAANTALVATLSAGVAMALVGLAVSPLIGLFFHSATIGRVAAVMSGYIVLRQSIIVPDALMQRRFSFLRRGIVEPVSALTFAATAITACSHGMGVWGLVLGWYAMGTSEVILAWGLARWKPDLSAVSFATWRELVRFGRHVFAAEFVRRSTAQLSTLFIGRFTGAAALGQFTYALRVASRPLDALVNTTAHVLYPAFARIADDPPRFRGAVTRSLRWTSVVAFPASLSLFALGEPVVVVVFGERWREAGQAVRAMCLFTAGQSFGSLGTEIFRAAGRPNLSFRMNVVGLVSTAAFMVALLPFGLLGIAAALSLQAVAVAVYSLRTISRVVEVPIREIASDLWPPAAASTVAVACIYPLDRLVIHADQAGLLPALGLLAAEACLGALIYLAVLRATAPSTANTLLGVMRRVTARMAQVRGLKDQIDADIPPGP